MSLHHKPYELSQYDVIDYKHCVFKSKRILWNKSNEIGSMVCNLKSPCIHIKYCYTPRLSVRKTSIVIGWFLVTCPWSNSNVSRSGYNWAVVVRASHVISAWLNLKWRDLQHVLTSAWFSYQRGQEQRAKFWSMLPSIFIIPSEFLFLIEIIKALYYYISN